MCVQGKLMFDRCVVQRLFQNIRCNAGLQMKEIFLQSRELNKQYSSGCSSTADYGNAERRGCSAGSQAVPMHPRLGLCNISFGDLFLGCQVTSLLGSKRSISIQNPRILHRTAPGLLLRDAELLWSLWGNRCTSARSIPT